ncbi:hypothetical protein BRADI_2g22645v3 [Brachypodium distachyon]|uniref:Uncharacterized protein n=1 Tax=Brachypodium distachyon TaxID=15368 RepID=A0A2K2D9V8_BRADI|nr:hypothetical protein BRADI_2g22645v3 [Brachypodium distachyon]
MPIDPSWRASPQLDIRSDPEEEAAMEDIYRLKEKGKTGKFLFCLSPRDERRPVHGVHVTGRYRGCHTAHNGLAMIDLIC